jgi:hypothetical protein
MRRAELKRKRISWFFDTFIHVEMLADAAHLDFDALVWNNAKPPDGLDPSTCKIEAVCVRIRAMREWQPINTGLIMLRLLGSGTARGLS